MPSLQRIALYLLFDSIENDLVEALRSIPPEDLNLTENELQKAKSVLIRRFEGNLDHEDSFDLVYGLDLGQKYDILLRNAVSLKDDYVNYLKSLKPNIGKALPVRNAIMHGRPLTIDEYSLGFSFAQDLLRRPGFWPILSKSYSEYNQNPEKVWSKSVSLLDDPTEFGVLHNLPIPDYEDTGFLKRPDLERELKQRILGRYPVITVQGDGGNGKTALTLQTVWNLVESDDHDFDLVLWYSAKTSSLTAKGVQEIESSYVDSLSIVREIATYGDDKQEPFESLLKVLTENKILLIIDNLETVTGPHIERLVKNVPGDSKLVLTSRVPVSGDLPISVGEFSESEGLRYLRSLVKAHGLKNFEIKSNADLRGIARRLGCKPLLLKWFALGVKSGASPERILADPKDAVQFCLENVMNRLSVNSKAVMDVLASVSDGLSPSVIGAIQGSSPQAIEDGLAELSRYTLVDVQDLPNSERVFRLRPFVRTYVIRIIRPNRDTLSSYFKKYNRIKARFEQSRARQKFDKYTASNLIVRTHGESVASEKIRHLTKKLLQGDLSGVEEGISQLKISDPGYFEIYRFEAFAAFTWSDIPRSIDAYEAALEYGESQPQLHFFFAGMLARSDDSDRAAEEFAKALELDPEASPVLREAARCEMRRTNFDVAFNYLSRADELSGDSLKESVLIIDLWVQYFQRKTDYLVNNDALTSANYTCGEMVIYLEKVDLRLFDRVIIDHILKIEPSLRTLKMETRIENRNAFQLDEWIALNILEKHNFGFEDGKFIGGLKEKGRRDNFGFLVDTNGREFFIAAANTSPTVWRWLNENNPVEFSVRTKNDGRKEAFNVSRLERY
ncbi:hypothetical protein E3U23_04385 [Erythrobacter litoralis]|uniref:hypothetical protein n=1 Tax=Erythrobacter litoralis TaxID=39960 RepID=UPI002435DD0C|nr:hypothetical protein [Erythrobacter litoralis]MDG6078428.1 hypothetical protein [Erythrobacter litoralis]